MKRLSYAKKGFTMIELMIVIFIIAILAAILVPNFIRARDVARLTACKTNLKNIATSLESYSADNSGHYPASLSGLTPAYLKALPLCPVAGSNTYTSSYVPTVIPDAFQMFCDGNNHSAVDVEPNYPGWSSASGLLERSP